MTTVEHIALVIIVACVAMATTTLCVWMILNMIAECRERKNK